LEKEKKDVERLLFDAENFDKSQKIVNYLNQRKKYLVEKDLFSKVDAEYFELGVMQGRKLSPLHFLDDIL